MIDELAKEHLHDELRWVRTAMLWKLDGLSEYDIRRPLTTSGTNLLGLIKHLSTAEARYFGEVFSRPFPEPVPPWDDLLGSDSWATEHESRTEISDRYRRVWDHSDTTIVALAIDARGHVPWWPRPDVTSFAVLVHVLTETNRHAGHADILREQLDGRIGVADDDPNAQRRSEFWSDRYATIQRAALAAAGGAATATADGPPSAAGQAGSGPLGPATR